MNTTTLMYTEASVIVREGWEILVETLGLQKATQFVILLERGKGDSIQEIVDYWGNANINEIYNQVQAWKTKQSSISRSIQQPIRV
jgi:hypothetical protein